MFVKLFTSNSTSQLKDFFFITNILDFYFLVSFLFLLNFFVFFKTENIIVKIISTILNLITVVFVIVNSSNEAFAYLFLITEMSAVLVVSPILLSKSKKNSSYKLNILYYMIIFSLVYLSILFFYYDDILKNFSFWKITPKDNIIQFNDLYSLFLKLNLSYNLWVFFSAVFICLNMLIINSVNKNKKSYK